MVKKQVALVAIGEGVVASVIAGVSWFGVSHLHNRQKATSTAAAVAATRPVKKLSTHAPAKEPLVTLAISDKHDEALARWLENWSDNPSYHEPSPNNFNN